MTLLRKEKKKPPQIGCLQRKQVFDFLCRSHQYEMHNTKEWCQWEGPCCFLFDGRLCAAAPLIASVFNVCACFLPVEQLMQQAACLPGHRECLGWNYSGNSILATVFPMGSSASSPSQAVCAPAIRQGATDRLLLLSKHYTWLAAHVCREWVSPRAQWITQARWTQPGDWELRLPVMEAWQDTMVGNAVQAWTH